jgi:hypothetical protein
MRAVALGLLAALVAATDAATVDFDLRELVPSIGPDFLDQPTSLAFGPDERLYVSTLGGKIHVYTLDDAYQVVDEEVITALAGKEAAAIAPERRRRSGHALARSSRSHPRRSRR